MNNQSLRAQSARGTFATALLVTGAAFAAAMPASAAPASTPPSPIATAPYTVSVFAQGPAGSSQPDSIVRWHDHIIVGFENHVAKDGTDSGKSTIVQYSLAGAVERTFAVPGHNDGLRVVDGNQLWSLQNEDANPNLVVIDLLTGTQTQYQFPKTPHGGGYDDIAVVHGAVYLTASNPSASPNTAPALVRATLSGNMVILLPVVYGNANAIDITTAQSVTLNLQDPDSMTVDPHGTIVFVSQADSELLFVRYPGSSEPIVGRLGLSTPSGATITIDDTAFATAQSNALIVSDINANTIYRIERHVLGASGFEQGQAYSASDTLGFVGTLNIDNGVVTPIVSGFGSPRGLVFLADDQASDSED